MASIDQKKQAIRERAESDLEFFINLIHPGRVLGHCHKEVIMWMTKQGASSHQLLLFPRDHQKSAMMAYRAAWEITKNPAIRILYISATSNLAIKQLDFIKEILTNETYRYYWPEMVHPMVSKRKKWTETEISVDHPLRKIEFIRDSTVFTAGLTTVITGMHFDIAFLDDVVIDANAYSTQGREDVEDQISYLASVIGAEGRIYVAGTRYHPEDAYATMINTVVDQYDEEGMKIGTYPLYDVYQRQVEDRGDGTGNFLWPRIQRTDGKSFGFDRNILAVKRASYKDYSKFRAQYYNDPSAIGGSSFSREDLQYYEKSHINRQGLSVFYKDRKLNVYAAIDFAYSLTDKSDYTAIVVIGIDCFSNIYILDIERFKTNKVSDYFEKILSLHNKWSFRKISCEVIAAQSVIVKDLKDNYIRKNGLALSIHEERPKSNKKERIEATLQPRYVDQKMWHYVGGNCELLEEELLAANPPHDDIMDALTNAVEIAVAPTMMLGALDNRSKLTKKLDKIYTSRFGGW